MPHCGKGYNIMRGEIRQAFFGGNLLNFAGQRLQASKQLVDQSRLTCFIHKRRADAVDIAADQVGITEAHFVETMVIFLIQIPCLKESCCPY